MKAKKNVISMNIKRLEGGRAPLRLVEDFVVSLGGDPEAQEFLSRMDRRKWFVQLDSLPELEVILDGGRSAEAVLYLGIRVTPVLIRRAHEIVTVALEVADSLVGCKVSLVGGFLVLSASISGNSINPENIHYHYSLLELQLPWFRDLVAVELGLDSLPEPQSI